MAYVPVPKDLTRVKSKFLFNLTKQQVVCFGLGALVGVPVFFLTKEAIGVSMAAALMIVIMLPFFMFAMFERNGQPLEVLLKHYIQARFVRPTPPLNRIRETDGRSERSFMAKKKEKLKLTRAEKKQLQELMTRMGPDSRAARVAAVVVGSSETIFYTMTVNLCGIAENVSIIRTPTAQVVLYHLPSPAIWLWVMI